MRRSQVLAKVSNGRPACCVAIGFTDLNLYEMLSLSGVDGIWMDMEHRGHSVETAANHIRAARVYDTDLIARSAQGKFMRIGRMLEWGDGQKLLRSGLEVPTAPTPTCRFC